VPRQLRSRLVTKFIRHALTGPLATFELKGGLVVAVYHDRDYEDDIENGAVFADGRALRPVDGRAFFDALDRAFLSSSFVSVLSR
jgi:hypothetical protein